jgi:hypothetical protein
MLFLPDYESDNCSIDLILKCSWTFLCIWIKTEIIKGTGNAVIPEGTRVTWKMNTQATQSGGWNCKTTFRKQKTPLFYLKIYSKHRLSNFTQMIR